MPTTLTRLRDMMDSPRETPTSLFGLKECAMGDPQITHFVELVRNYAPGVVVFLMLASVGASVVARNLSAWLDRWHGAILNSPTDYSIEVRDEEEASGRHLTKAGRTRDAASFSLVARARVVVRIAEATTSRTQQLSTQKWSKISANLLTIAQYIIGGVLASSFVQESLTPKWVGGLGVLVLIASLFKQQFHPEVNAEDARKKASKLQGLVRSSEDQLAILDAKTAAGQDHSDAMITLLTQITQRLTEIENPEATETKPQLTGTKPS
jgi:hypothetical protein